MTDTIESLQAWIKRLHEQRDDLLATIDRLRAAATGRSAERDRQLLQKAYLAYLDRCREVLDWRPWRESDPLQAAATATEDAGEGDEPLPLAEPFGEIDAIDRRMLEIKAELKRLRAERRVAVLREQERATEEA